MVTNLQLTYIKSVSVTQMIIVYGLPVVNRGQTFMAISALRFSM